MSLQDLADRAGSPATLLRQVADSDSVDRDQAGFGAAEEGDHQHAGQQNGYL